MPLSTTPMPCVPHQERAGLGFWMATERNQPIRVFVTFDALAHFDSYRNPRELLAALEIFRINRTKIEAVASEKFDSKGVDEGEFEGQPIVMVRPDDLSSFLPVYAA